MTSHLVLITLWKVCSINLQVIMVISYGNRTEWSTIQGGNQVSDFKAVECAAGS